MANGGGLSSFYCHAEGDSEFFVRCNVGRFYIHKRGYMKTKKLITLARQIGYFFFVALLSLSVTGKCMAQEDIPYGKLMEALPTLKSVDGLSRHEPIKTKVSGLKNG